MDFRFLKKEIKRNIVGYVAIVVMTVFGVGFLSGLFSCLPDIKHTVDEYYKETNFHDIRITSTLGFLKEDIKEVERIENLDKIQPVHSLYSLASVNGNGSYAAYVRSMDRSVLEANAYALVDAPVLKEGSYPATPKSCLVVNSGAVDVDVKIGDRLALLTNTNECTENTFTVTGFVNTPEFTSNIKETAPVGNGKTEIIVYVSDEIFTDDAYCNEILCTLKNTEELSTFDSDYAETVQAVKNQLVKLGNARAENFAVTLANQYQDDLSKAKKHYEYVKGQTEEELKTVSGNISALEKSISELETTVAEEEKEVMRLKIEADNLAGTDNSETSSQSVNTEFAPMVNEESSENVSSEESKNESNADSFDATPKKENDAHKNALKKYEEANKKYETDKKDLETKKATLKSLKAEYSILKGLAGKKVDNAEQSVEQLGGEQENYQQKWSVLTRSDNISYNSFLMNAQKINTISGFFPVIFFVVALSLVLTLIARMINSQRRELGIWQSFGYSDKAITLKYAVYSLSATIIGGIIGIVLGVIAVPKLMFKAYSVFFNFPEIKLLFKPFATFGAFLIEAALVLAVTVFCCYRLLKGSPAELLRPAGQLEDKEIFLQKNKKRWNKYSASKKERLKNIFAYKSRLAVMLIGITGCTALIFSCFSLNHSIGSVTEKQYDLRPFDATVILNSDDYLQNQSIKDFLGNKKLVKEYLEVKQGKTFAFDEKKSYEITAVCMDNQKINDYYKLENADDKSVIISRNFARLSGLDEGDEFAISFDNKKVTVKITDVAQSYIGSYVFLGKNACRSITNSLGKVLLIKKSENSFNKGEIVSNLLATNKIYSVSFAEDEMIVFNNAADKIKNLLNILIVSAILLGAAAILITSLLNHHERRDKIQKSFENGADAKSISKGILAENLTITLFGVIFGIILGIILHMAVVSLADMGDVILSSSLGVLPFAVSVLIPIVFTVTVGIAVYFLIKFKQKKTA